MEKKIKKVRALTETKIQEKKKEEVYKTFAVMFKIEGHDTWRIGLYPNKQAFDTYLNHPGQKSHPKVTERRWFTVDRINGLIIEEK